MADNYIYSLFTDGGARGNPGPAGVGAVIFDSERNEVAQYLNYIGEKTNNEAEYMALALGLQLAINNKITKLNCYLDSELIVKQLNGEYKVKQPHLQELNSKVKDLAKRFDNITYNHVPRKENSFADGLVNQAIDAATKKN